MLADLSRRLGAVLGSVVFLVTALAAAVNVFIAEIAPELPAGWQDNATRIGGAIVSVLGAAALAIRRVTEVRRDQRGLLPPDPSTPHGGIVIPTIGRIVIYKSKIDNGPGNDVLSPALITRTRATTVPAVIDRWGPEPSTVASASDPTVTHETAARPDDVVAELPDDDTVDLVVFGLGKTYREYSVPRGDGRGEWAWPPRV